MIITKIKGDKGSPCLIPLLACITEVYEPLMLYV